MICAEQLAPQVKVRFGPLPASRGPVAQLAGLCLLCSLVSGAWVGAGLTATLPGTHCFLTVATPAHLLATQARSARSAPLTSTCLAPIAKQGTGTNIRRCEAFFSPVLPASLPAAPATSQSNLAREIVCSVLRSALCAAPYRHPGPSTAPPLLMVKNDAWPPSTAPSKQISTPAAS